MSGTHSIFYSIVSTHPLETQMHTLSNKNTHSLGDFRSKILITQLRLVPPKVQQSGLIRILNPHTYHNCCVFCSCSHSVFSFSPSATHIHTHTLFVPVIRFVSLMCSTHPLRDRMQFCHAFMNRAEKSSSTEGKKSVQNILWVNICVTGDTNITHTHTHTRREILLRVA